MNVLPKSRRTSRGCAWRRQVRRVRRRALTGGQDCRCLPRTVGVRGCTAASTAVVRSYRPTTGTARRGRMRLPTPRAPERPSAAERRISEDRRGSSRVISTAATKAAATSAARSCAPNYRHGRDRTPSRPRNTLGRPRRQRRWTRDRWFDRLR